jgi:hypothetical protein
MMKFLMIALSLGAFAIAGMAIQAEAEARPCVKGPKDHLPCPVTLQRPQHDKTRSN